MHMHNIKNIKVKIAGFKYRGFEIKYVKNVSCFFLVSMKLVKNDRFYVIQNNST